MVSLRYKISWVDWNIYQIPVKVYILDSTDKVRSNGSKILHDCLVDKFFKTVLYDKTIYFSILLE